jgi:hypothetical protein
MGLHAAFTHNYSRFLQWFYQAFQNSESLYKELRRIAKIVRLDNDSTELFDEFEKDARPHEDAVFNNDESVLIQIPCLQRAGIPQLFEHLTPEERKVFWTNLHTLFQTASMLKACSRQSGNLKKMAVNMDRNMSPEDYQQKVMQDMFSGGSTTNDILDTFQEKGAIREILENFGGLLRQPGEEKLDLGVLADMIEKEDLSNIKEEFKAMRESIDLDDDDNPMSAFFKQACSGKGAVPGSSVNPMESMQKMTQRMQEAAALSETQGTGTDTDEKSDKDKAFGTQEDAQDMLRVMRELSARMSGTVKNASTLSAQPTLIDEKYVSVPEEKKH